MSRLAVKLHRLGVPEDRIKSEVRELIKHTDENSNT